ncbi:MAG TPA: ATP-binding domain-containing protein [Polyangiaceae bacterium]|jgi:DNA helicase IV
MQLSPRPLHARRRAPSLIDVELAPAQRDAVTLPAERSLLVLGEAGHGKTTVALHRVAHLWRNAAESIRACVIVPTEGLERWLQPLLRKLGADVEVLAYEKWAAAQARAAFRELPRRESEDATPGVARLKRHPALRLVLGEIAERGTREHARRSDLLHLFGDRALLDRVAEAASGTVTPRMVADVLEHTHIQFSRTAEEEWAHVTDRERLVAVDGLALDAGTASADARSVDTEDYAVLFEIDRLRALARGTAPAAPRAFDLVMLDEAQELAPLELSLIGRSLAPGGTLVVAGDPAQQIDPSVTFTSWESTMRELSCPAYASATLDVGYRCPPGVVALARRVLDGATPAPASASVFPLELPDEAALAAWIARELSVLTRRDRTATTAVICRSPLFARRLVERLRLGVPARLVLDGRFLVRGGVQVTTVDQVKGLEFDTVVVPDATAAAYPDEGAARRALYVAVTRTRHQLVVASVGERTPLLPRG